MKTFRFTGTEVKVLLDSLALVGWPAMDKAEPERKAYESARAKLEAATTPVPVAAAGKKLELYVTQVEQEAYDLGGQLAVPPNQVRSHVEDRMTVTSEPYYVVVVDAPEAWDRAVAVRRRMFGS